LAGRRGAVPPSPRAAMEDQRRGALIGLGTWGCASALLLGVESVVVGMVGIHLLATLSAAVLVRRVSAGTPVRGAGMGQCDGVK